MTAMAFTADDRKVGLPGTWERDTGGALVDDLGVILKGYEPLDDEQQIGEVRWEFMMKTPCSGVAGVTWMQATNVCM